MKLDSLRNTLRPHIEYRWACHDPRNPPALGWRIFANFGSGPRISGKLHHFKGLDKHVEVDMDSIKMWIPDTENEEKACDIFIRLQEESQSPV